MTNGTEDPKLVVFLLQAKDRPTMPLFRIDAVISGAEGQTDILTTRKLKAKTAADAEKAADKWAEISRLASVKLRIVKADIILAERRMGEKEWSRS